MEGSNRALYAQVGLSYLPHILGMVDRNPLSPTYGCFDRAYWHYKTAAFPSGMYQEFVLPLALSYRHPFPGGEAYFGQPRMRELALAGIRYAARSAHADGSCDDYFPYERAQGAVAFSLYATCESCLLLDLGDQADLLAFFRKRAQWLMEHMESGRLSNHQALTVLALCSVYQLTGDDRFLEGARKRRDVLLGWQTEEGWFPEYEGCDPGYLTATIDFLAKYLRKSRDTAVLEPLKDAIRFASHFVHPDGSYGGTYGSRNTSVFFPHGFELMGAMLPEASEAADLYLRGVRDDRRVHLDDDRICAHLAYNHLQAYLDFWEGAPRGQVRTPRPERRYWKGARIYFQRDERRHAVVSAAKGGVVRLYVDGHLAYTDSGLIARLANGAILVSHLVDDYDVRLQEEGIQVEGHFGQCRFRLPTPWTQAVFHLGMLLVGRWWSDLVRRLLQHLLIVGKRTDPMRFRRSLLLGEDVRLIDEIWNPRSGHRNGEVLALYAGTDHTSMYVAMGNCHERACLFPWTDYRSYLDALNREGFVRVERVIG